MAVGISVRSNIKTFTKKLPSYLKDQVPFATSVAINETAKKVAKAQRIQAERIFDRPTPYLLSGIGSIGGRGSFAGIRSTKRNLRAILIPGFNKRDKQAGDRINEVIKRQAQGGTRLPEKRALVVPVARGQKNRYGNIPNKRVEQLLRKPNVFQAGRAQGLPPGIYERTRRGGLKMLIAYEPRADYRRLYPYERIAKGVVQSNLDKEFRKAFAKAVRTARIR